MNTDKLTVNRPLAGTFRWLGVGGTQVAAPAWAEETAYTLGEGESRTVVLSSEAPAVRVSAELGKDAVLRLIQVRQGGDGAAVSDVRVRCGERARFEWHRVVLGGAQTYDNCSVALEGDGSSFAADLGFRLSGDERLDVNCEAVHTGKRTRSDILASGVLRDRAFKLLRGTIDFRTGCTGSAGKELEDVLLMDDAVRNQTVPVILCGEEDVTGDHGATIGRLGEDLLFYLESRGLEREAARELMARARVDAVIRRIPDETVVRALLPEETP